MVRPSAFLLAALLPFPALALGPAPVSERYDVSIAGIGIGEATLTLAGAEGRYEIEVDGGFRFLFWSGAANATSRGGATAALSPESYSARFESPSRTILTEIAFGPGATEAAFSAEPPFDADGETEPRVPILPEHLVGALDPIAAFLVRAESGTEACSGERKVFSGAVRFDVAFAPAARAAAPGLMPCDAAYRRVSGHRVESEGASLLEEKGLSLDLFEIAPGLWAPHRLGLPTRYGTLSLERTGG